MIDITFFNDIAKKVSNALPPGLKNCQQEVEKTVKATLQATFAKLNLVTLIEQKDSLQ